MDTDQLRTFERIVREGSFSRAAWSLDVAQPTVSARMQALEQQVGGPLFVRSGRGVALTDLGMSFLPYARRALEVLDAGVEAAQQAQVGQRGRVSIGVLESLSGSFLGPAVARFHAEHPDVEVLVRAGRQEQLVELLYDAVIRLAFLVWPAHDLLTGDIEILLTLREPVVLAVAPHHPLARRPQVDRATVAALSKPFLLLRWWVTLPPAVAQLATLAKSVVDVPMDTGRQMVLSGVGAGVFPWMQVADFVKSGQMTVVQVTDLPLLERDSVLVRRRAGPPLSVADEALVTTVRERAAALGLIPPDRGRSVVRGGRDREIN
ncbi:MAG: LysR family transcriptional regulator [Chloroflexi bacterium]|nr:LysR family transcriptional regulator [Chloroflexota bacterium]